MRHIVTRSAPLLVLVAFLASCARHPSVEKENDTSVCENQKAFRLGVEDGEEGKQMRDLRLKECGEVAFPALRKRYRNGYELGKARARSKKEQSSGPIPMVETTKTKKNLDQAPSWICEVEASSKVFTGVGQSESAALKAAQDTCGAHFQAKECSEFSECRQSL